MSTHSPREANSRSFFFHFILCNWTRSCHDTPHVSFALCDVKTRVTAEQDDPRGQRRKQGVGGQGPERPFDPRDRTGPRQAVIQVRTQRHDIRLAAHPRRIGDRRLQLKRHLCHNTSQCEVWCKDSLHTLDKHSRFYLKRHITSHHVTVWCVMQRHNGATSQWGGSSVI